MFPGRSEGGFLNQDAMADVLAKLRPGLTVHGFRSTFRDWAAETTGYPNHVSKWRSRTPSRTVSRPPTAAATFREAEAADGGMGRLFCFTT